MIAWVLFKHPMILDAGGWSLWLLGPLCLSVAITYKTIRIDRLRRLPLEVLWLMGYIAAGLAALGAGLWLIQAYWP